MASVYLHRVFSILLLNRQPATTRPFVIEEDGEEMRGMVDTVSDGEAIVSKTPVVASSRRTSRSVKKSASKLNAEEEEKETMSAPETIPDDDEVAHDDSFAIVASRTKTTKATSLLDKHEKELETRDDRLKARDMKRANRRHP